MVKIRLLDGVQDDDDEEAFLALERHDGGFAVALVDSDGDKIDQPFILFLKPNSQGKLTLNLALTPSQDFVQRDGVTNAIALNPAH